MTNQNVELAKDLELCEIHRSFAVRLRSLLQMTNRPDDRKQDDTTTDEIEHEEEGLPLRVVDVTLLRLAYDDKRHVREDLQQPRPP